MTELNWVKLERANTLVWKEAVKVRAANPTIIKWLDETKGFR